MITVAVFLLALPLAVQTFAAILHLIDQPDRAQALRSVCGYLILLITLILVGGPENRIWVGGAFLCIGLLHLTAQLLMRSGVSRGWWVSDRIE